MDIESLKYPIGKFTLPVNITDEILAGWINDIKTFPARINREVIHLNKAQLDTLYRPDGWTVRQVVHHCADSHMNSIIRFKLALTEDTPVIKPYFEDRWAQLPDMALDVSVSIKLLQGLHERWTALLEHLDNQLLKKTFIHPESGREIPLEENIGIYAWHCNHHLAHITQLKKREGWE